MTSKTPSIIAGLSTFFILIALGVLSVFGEMVILNGASESQGFNAISTSLIFQSVGLLLAVVLARWLPNFLIVKFNWNNILAVVTAVFAAVLLGGLTSILSRVVSTLLAGIK